MKIAVLGFRTYTYQPIQPRGHEFFLNMLIDALVDRGHDVTYYGPPDTKTRATLRSLDRVPVSENPAFQAIPYEQRNFIYTVLALEHTAWAVRDAELRGAEVVHTMDGFPWVHQATMQIPHVMTMNHREVLPHDAQRVLMACFPSWANVELVNISHDQRKQYPEEVRARVVYNGIDLRQFPLGEGSGGYLAFMSRVCAHKGAHTAIEIAQRTGAQLRIAGGYDKADPTYFEERIRPHLNDQIQYLGHLESKEKLAFLAGARALLFPIEWPEPFGNAMTEGMACGTPVIATRLGSVPEVVRHGTSGFVCDGIEDMIKAVAAVGSLSRKGVREDMAERFPVEKMVSGYEAAYRDAIQRYVRPVLP